MSALLFILAAEILSIKLRANKDAKGITIDNWEYKIFQLADDTTILAKELKSLKLIITDFLKFQKISGLTLSLPHVSTSMFITGDHVCRPRVDGNNIYFFFPFSVLLYVFFGVSVLNRLFKYFK